MTFVLGNRSLQTLTGVHPDLVRVVKRAIELTPVDFTVLEGVRRLVRQKHLVAIGASITLDSRHLTGHAVDLGAWVDGGVEWSWPLYFKIAEAMRDGADELDIPLTWGGCWQMINGVDDLYAAQTATLNARKPKAGNPSWTVRTFTCHAHISLSLRRQHEYLEFPHGSCQPCYRIGG